jgi:uncharacterized protein YdhG (YjbR/CyaY superfamily)
MNTNAVSPQNIDEYIANFPLEIQQILLEIRAIIQKAAPEASEKISYGMPTFVLEGNLVHFAAFKHHIGFYSTPSGTSQFQQEILKYKHAKGSIQFPLGQPMPFDLIVQIVKFRVAENLAKAARKPNKKSRALMTIL